MSFNHDQSWKKLNQLMKSGQTACDNWNQFIDFHKDIKPKRYWGALKKLPIEAEQQEIKEWLELAVTGKPLSKTIISFWIGINKFTDGKSDDPICAMYLSGCRGYSKDDIEWAVKPAYSPEYKFLASDVLDGIEKKIHTDKKDYSFLDWILPLAYCSLTLTETIKKLDKKKFLNHQKKIFVTTGHDGGDFINLKAIGQR